jgi:DNA-binding MarR family transcriptional regulator
MNDEGQDVVYKIFRLLRENVVIILTVLREQEGLRWKELQDETGIATATFNRALAALQEMHFIEKPGGRYRLTWAGRLVVDGFFLLGWRMADTPESIEDYVAETVLAKDIVMVTLMIILVSLRLRGRINIEELEQEIMEETAVITRILDEYEQDGYIVRENGVIRATDRLDELAPQDLFSLE